MSNLPPTNEDPAIIEGRATRAAYAKRVDSIRRNAELSELDRARQVVQTYADTNKKLGELSHELHGRRIANLRQIEAKAINVGAAIPEGTSPADRAILMQAFNSALDRTRSLDTDKLRGALSQAARFGDEATLRAIETLALEEGRAQILEDVRAINPERVANLEAYIHARDLVENRGIDGSFTWQALGPVTQPTEAYSLGALEVVEQKRVNSRYGTAAPRTL